MESVPKRWVALGALLMLVGSCWLEVNWDSRGPIRANRSTSTSRTMEAMAILLERSRRQASCI